MTDMNKLLGMLQFFHELNIFFRPCGPSRFLTQFIPSYTSQLAGLLVDKCLGARPKTKEDATQVLMLMIEVDKESEPVVVRRRSL